MNKYIEFIGVVISAFVILNLFNDKQVVEIEQLSEKSCTIKITGYIDEYICEKLLAILYNVDEKIDIVLKIRTYGGDGHTFKIINYLLLRKGKKTAVIDSYAYSAGSFIALSCNEIIMNTNDKLGPVDPQLFYYKYLIYYYMKVPSKTYTEAMEHVTRYTTYHLERILKNGSLSHLSTEDFEIHLPKVIDLFMNSRSHSTPILASECLEVGINIKLN